MVDQSSSEAIQSTLQEMLAKHLLPGAKICLAYSGGLDSTVLMHALQQCAGEFELRAIHVDHGLQAASAGWAATCADIAEQTGVAYSATKVSVHAAAGKGIEAAARAARYQALRDLLEPNEVLLTAHHQRDQVETLLLQMLRGAGVHGLAAMPVLRVDNGLNIFRPLLTVSADAIRAYAAENALHWIEDPSNASLDMDRNYLRHEVLPLLSERRLPGRRPNSKEGPPAGLCPAAQWEPPPGGREAGGAGGPRPCAHRAAERRDGYDTAWP